MSEMTLSEALRLKAKIQGQLKELRDRAAASVSYLEKSPPAFPLGPTLERIDQLRGELSRLAARIEVTNATTPLDVALPGGTVRHFNSLTEVVKELQSAKGHLAWIKGLVTRAQADTVDESNEYSTAVEKYVMVERRWRCDLPEAARAAMAEQLQDMFDALNGAIEKVNSATPLAG